MVYNMLMSTENLDASFPYGIDPALIDEDWDRLKGPLYLAIAEEAERLEETKIMHDMLAMWKGERDSPLEAQNTIL
jgi:hypothetical protein